LRREAWARRKQDKQKCNFSFHDYLNLNLFISLPCAVGLPSRLLYIEVYLERNFCASEPTPKAP
jgi:hypothetical protein